MIAASMRTLPTVGSLVELKLLHGLRLTLWPTRTKLLAISPSTASEPSFLMMLALFERPVSVAPIVGRTITSLAAAIVSDVE